VVDVLGKALSRMNESKAPVPIRAVMVHCLLGLAYEPSVWDQRSVDKYREFLEIRKDADPGTSEVGYANERMARSKSKI
jgi:hypothetical protein